MLGRMTECHRAGRLQRRGLLDPRGGGSNRSLAATCLGRAEDLSCRSTPPGEPTGATPDAVSHRRSGIRRRGPVRGLYGPHGRGPHRQQGGGSRRGGSPLDGWHYPMGGVPFQRPGNGDRPYESPWIDHSRFLDRSSARKRAAHLLPGQLLHNARRPGSPRVRELRHLRHLGPLLGPYRVHHPLRGSLAMRFQPGAGLERGRNIGQRHLLRHRYV